ncbi:tetratricopeptide repeat protein [Streptomyces incarnatus]|uniref:Tetratricopeptide repeat protein n=1 Tax=Streptomyces incarnatus TaxID=665007 RepID=A0ABN4GIL1_9ACTN|nr:tetratricopeptide repeat protein [Streptomyces incarnatus]AKJ13495.1 tetratricopeptide repeat protein [Streptomyces incarnatus]
MHESEAEQLIKQAYEAWDAEDWLSAAGLLERVLAGFPDLPESAVWWYDAALAHKFLRNWAKAYELGREAAARAPRGEGEPAHWNLGIAATIQRDWATAREAWTGFGIQLLEGEGEINGRFGPACVRLDTGGEREVVWIDRLCPTRGRVMNVPVTAGRRFGEIVVHDGEPKGRRVVDGREYPVFDELLLFETSDLPTFTVTVKAGQASDIEALVELFLAQGYGAEPASSFELLCACCSEGTLERRRSVHGGAQQVSLAASEEEARRLLDQWVTLTPAGRAWSGLAPVG